LFLRGFVEARRDFEVGAHVTRLWRRSRAGATRRFAHNA
jgi:hypothetical protein